MKHFLSYFLLALLLLIPFSALAQEEEVEEIGYIKLGDNFAVPELANWDAQQEGEAILFSEASLNAQIYVAPYDTQNVDEAILSAVDAVYTGELGEPIFSSRIGRNDSTGTWEYRLFSADDTSISAYALLKSGRTFVVLFIETSSDYTAYHLALRSIAVEDEAIETAINTASMTAIGNILGTEYTGEILASSNPAANNAAWILAEYPDGLATASYLNNDIVYITYLEGNSDIAPTLSNAFDTIFLGFTITPDNSEYMYLGLAFTAIIFLALIGSMWLRHQNLKKDMKMLEQLADE